MWARMFLTFLVLYIYIGNTIYSGISFISHIHSFLYSKHTTRMTSSRNCNVIYFESEVRILNGKIIRRYVYIYTRILLEKVLESEEVSSDLEDKRSREVGRARRYSASF